MKQHYDAKKALREKAKAYPLLQRLPGGTSTLIDLFLLNFFKEKTDSLTTQDISSLLSENIPGRNLFKNMLMAGAAWSCVGVESQSGGESKRKYLKKFQTARSYALEKGILGFFSKKTSLYTGKIRQKSDVSTLLHELTHALCLSIYQNRSEPYSVGDNTHRHDWQAYIESLSTDLELDLLTLQAKIIANTATSEEQQHYDFYKTILGFKLTGYQPSEYICESISHLVEALVEHDLNDYRRLSENTKQLARKLLRRFSTDCFEWALTTLQDAGIGLLEDPLLCDALGSDLARALAGNLTQTGMLYCSEIQADLISVAMREHKPIIDLWFEKLKFEKEPLFRAWQDALLHQRISLDGLFEALIRYFSRVHETNLTEEFFKSCFENFFDLVDKFEPTFDFSRTIAYICKNYSPLFTQCYFDMARARYPKQFQPLESTMAYWLGASGHLNAPFQVSSAYTEDMLKGAVRYGKAALVEALAQLYPEEIQRIVSAKEFDLFKMELVLYGHKQVIEQLCRVIPALRKALIPYYLCIANRKNLSFTEFRRGFDLDSFDEALISHLIDQLCRMDLYKELEQLINCLVEINPQWLQGQKLIFDFMKLKNPRPFEIIANVEAERYAKDASSQNILHKLVLFNRFDLAVILKKNHLQDFEELAMKRDMHGNTPFSDALKCGDFRLAALMNLGGFINAVETGKISAELSQIQKAEVLSVRVHAVASLLAQVGEKFEKSLLKFLDQHRDADLTKHLETCENSDTVLHHAAAHNLRSIVYKILERWPALCSEKNNAGLSPLEVAMQQGHIECAALLCHHEHLRADPLRLRALILSAVRYDCPQILDMLLLHHRELFQAVLPEPYHDIEHPTIDMIATIEKSHKVLAWLAARRVETAGFCQANPIVLLTLQNDPEQIEETLQQVISQHGARYFKMTDDCGRFPIHFAAASSLRICQAIYREYPDNPQDADGNSPLHIAILKRKSDNAKFLIEVGKVPQVQNNAGMHPIHLAAGSSATVLKSILAEHPDEVNVLTALPVGANAAEFVPKSPLVLAIEKGNEPAALLLLTRGAETNYPGYDTNRLTTMARDHAMYAVAKAIFNKTLSDKIHHAELKPL